MLSAPSPLDSPAPPDVRPTLAVVAVRVRDETQLDGVLRRLVSLSSSAPGVPLVAAAGSDSSPALLDTVALAAEELGGELVRGPAGVVAAMNAGLRAAREEGVDAVVVAGDVELDDAEWLPRLGARRDTLGRPAAVVGARLLHPGGLVAAAGQYFSPLSRDWQPRLRFAPSDLPAALAPCLCPVGGLVLIRAETLARIGLLDEELNGEHAVLDFCLRAFAAGLECVYEPSALARMQADPAPAVALAPVDEREHQRSTRVLRAKHRHTDFSLWTPEV